MGKQQEFRQAVSGSCFRLVPSIPRNDAATRGNDAATRCDVAPEAAPVVHEDPSDQLREARDEAQQNWEALMETRGQLSEVNHQLDAASRSEEHMRARIRRLRGKVAVHTPTAPTVLP